MDILDNNAYQKLVLNFVNDLYKIVIETFSFHQLSNNILSKYILNFG